MKTGTYELEFTNIKTKKTSWIRFVTTDSVVRCLKNSLGEVGIEISLVDTGYRGCNNPSIHKEE